MIDALGELIRNRKVILFAGSGVSANLGLPTWSGLVDHMAEDLGFNPRILAPPGASNLTVSDFYVLQKGIGPLRSWMDRKWDVPDDRLMASAIHNDIVDLNFPFIYTTNFDRALERIHELRGKPFSKITSVASIAEASASDTHVVKFHGDFDDDDSLVLAESKYLERLAFEHPLDIKLRADALGRSILFVGYSLTDINIRLLLYRLQKTWQSYGDLGVRPQSYVYMTRPDPVQRAVLEAWGVKTITADVDDISHALPSLFGELKALLKSP